MDHNKRICTLSQNHPQYILMTYQLGMATIATNKIACGYSTKHWYYNNTIVRNENTFVLDGIQTKLQDMHHDNPEST